MSNNSPAIYITRRGRVSRLWRLFHRAWIAAYEDNCFGIAKGAAYSALLSFFPVLTSTTALLVEANAEAVSRVITRLLFEVSPPGTQELLRNYLAGQGHRPGALLTAATILSIWGASGAMMSLMEGFQAAYSLPRGRPFIKQRAMAAVLVICAVLPLVFGSVAILFGTRSERAITEWLGIAKEGQLASSVVWLTRATRNVAALASIMVAAALLFYMGPNRPMRFRSVWPGAMLTTVLWLVATQIFGLYVRHLANYNVLYGSIAAVIALVVWMYVLAVVALVGCEFNVAYEDDQAIRATAQEIPG